MAIEFFIGTSNGSRDPPEHFDRSFQDPALFVPAQVTLFKNGKGIFREGGHDL
jgi:hypothetical protein